MKGKYYVIIKNYPKNGPDGASGNYAIVLQSSFERFLSAKKYYSLHSTIPLPLGDGEGQIMLGHAQTAKGRPALPQACRTRNVIIFQAMNNSLPSAQS